MVAYIEAKDVNLMFTPPNRAPVTALQAFVLMDSPGELHLGSTAAWLFPALVVVHWVSYRKWFAGPWRAFTRDVLLDKTTRERGMVDPVGVEEVLAGGGTFDRGLYSALALELWCRSFLDG